MFRDVEKLLHTGRERYKLLFTIFIDDPIMYCCHVRAFSISIRVKGHLVYIGLPVFSLGASSIAAPSPLIRGGGTDEDNPFSF
jgi:hypothetical protein